MCGLARRPRWIASGATGTDAPITVALHFVNVAQHLYVWRCVPQRPPACGNAARFAHLSLLGSDPVAYQVEVERSRHEREIKTLEDKFASEVAAAKDAARREMIAEVASVRRELIAVALRQTS